MTGDRFTGHDNAPQPASTELSDIIARGTRGDGPQAPQRPQDVREQAQPGHDSVRVGTDATNTSVITNKTLELSFKDPNFDNKLLFASGHGADKFNRIKIDDLPSNVLVHTWMDKNGYFFWYDDGTRGPKDHHYLPNNAFEMQANQSKIDLEQERLSDNKQFAKANFGGFRNFDRSYLPSYDGTTNSTSYYWKIAGASPDALAVQEHALRESVRSSSNPYYKIYLSDINAAQALQPLREQAEQGHSFDPKNDYTLKKIDTALSLSNAAYEQTRGELNKVNQFPSLNVYLPLAPQRPYWDYQHQADDFIGFWGGGYNQSYGRQQNLNSLRGLITTGVIPRVHDIPNQP